MYDVSLGQHNNKNKLDDVTRLTFSLRPKSTIKWLWFHGRCPEHRYQEEQVELVRPVLQPHLRHRRNQEGAVHLVSALRGHVNCMA